jgi:hypothetical protein
MRAIGYGRRTPLPETCLANEIYARVKILRLKRTKGLWKGHAVLHSLVVRGKPIRVLNNCKGLKLVSDDEQHSVLQWFVDEMRNDLLVAFRPAAGAASSSDPAPLEGPPAKRARATDIGSEASGGEVDDDDDDDEGADDMKENTWGPWGGGGGW